MKPLIYYVFAGLQQMSQSVFKCTPQISTTEQLKQLLLNKKLTGNAYMVLTNCEISDETIRAQKASRGVLLRHEQDTDLSVDRIVMLPVQLTIEMHYFHSDFMNILDFVSKWIFASLKYRMNYKITYKEVDLPVTVTLNPSLAIPTKDIYSPAPDLYHLQGEMQVTGWITNEDPRDIQQVPLIGEINADLI